MEQIFSKSSSQFTKFHQSRKLIHEKVGLVSQMMEVNDWI